MLLPLSKIWSSLVTRCPSAVISLQSERVVSSGGVDRCDGGCKRERGVRMDGPARERRELTTQ